MKSKTHLTQAYLIQLTAVKEHDAVAQCFTHDFGLLSFYCSNLYPAKRQNPSTSSAKSIAKAETTLAQLQPACLLEISFRSSRHSSLAKPLEIQRLSVTPPLDAEQLALLSYLHELLRLFKPESDDTQQGLFLRYQQCLVSLFESTSNLLAMRRFEALLLRQAGWPINLQLDINGQPLQRESFYCLSPAGLHPASAQDDQQAVFSGAAITAFVAADIASQHQAAAKRLFQICFQLLFPTVRLKSRVYLQQLIQYRQG